jgi:hypothetical protein
MSSITPLVIDLLDTFLIVAKVVLGILAVTMGLGILSFLMENSNFAFPAIQYLSIAVFLAVLLNSSWAWLNKIFKPMKEHRKMKKIRNQYEAKHRAIQEKKWYGFIHALVEEKKSLRTKPLF